MVIFAGVQVCLAEVEADNKLTRESLAEQGIEFGFGVTNVYQQNLRGGLSKHRKAGRFSGSYDIELTCDCMRHLYPRQFQRFSGNIPKFPYLSIDLNISIQGS